jgi:hypothetical protein
MLVARMQPPNSAMSSPFPRKIGSALAAFENTINKNKVNGGPGPQVVLKDAAASPCIVPSWKKRYRCNTPGAPAKDAIDSSTALTTSRSASVKKRMEDFASVNKLPFSESEDTVDTAEANLAQVPDDPPMKGPETRAPADANRESRTSEKSVSRQNSLVELAPPRLSSVKCLRTNSVISTDTVTDIASILDRVPFSPTHPRQQSESFNTPTKKVARWRVGQTVRCANDGDAEVQKVKQSLRLPNERRQSKFQNDRESEHETSLGSLPALEPLRSDSFDSLPEEPLPQSLNENKWKNTQDIRIHKGQVSAKVISDGQPSRPSRSVSRSLSPPDIPPPGIMSTSSGHPSGVHSRSHGKTSKGNVGTFRSILKCGKIPIERYEKLSQDSELETEQRSTRSLLKPKKSSLSRGPSKYLRVTFADGVVVPRCGPRRNSMVSVMSICTDKDTLPKQPRRHSMSDVEEVRRKSKRLQDPGLHRRRFCRMAVTIQDFIRRKLRRLRFVKIIAATRIQALFRGVMQRMRDRLAMLEQRLANIEAKRQRQISSIQTKKWKKMETYRQKAAQKNREIDATAKVKVVEVLRRENIKLQDQNSKLLEACSLLREMNGQIERTLEIHSNNFATMGEAIEVLAERNARTFRMSKKYEMRNEMFKQKFLTAKKNGTSENNFRKELEQTTADMIASVSLVGDKELTDTITAMRLFTATKVTDNEGMLSCPMVRSK